MRHITRGATPQPLQRLHDLTNDDWQPSWDDLADDGPRRRVVHGALLAEQGGLCCYCESPAAQGTRTPGWHIEHLHPRSRFPDRVLDHDNLVVSCGGRQTPRLHAQELPPPDREAFCGHRKGDWFDAELFVSPTDPRCECAFVFHSNGKVSPREDSGFAPAARETLRRLNLDARRLRRARRDTLAALDAVLMDDAAPLSRDELARWRDSFTQRDHEGCLQPYPSACIQHLQREIDVVDAPTREAAATPDAGGDSPHR